MTRTRWWILSLAGALALGVAAGAWWFGRGPAPARIGPASPARIEPPSSAPPPEAPAPADQPFLSIEGTNLSGSDQSGRRLWDLRAKTLQVDNARRRIALTSVTGQFYQGGRAEVVFSAPRALFEVDSRNVELSGGVVARTADGRVLRAARVRYDAGTRSLNASGGVALTQPGMSIRADAVRADAALEQTRFSGNILVRVTE